MGWSKDVEEFREGYKEDNGEYPSDDACNLLESFPYQGDDEENQ